MANQRHPMHLHPAVLAATFGYRNRAGAPLEAEVVARITASASSAPTPTPARDDSNDASPPPSRLQLALRFLNAAQEVMQEAVTGAHRSSKADDVGPTAEISG